MYFLVAFLNKLSEVGECELRRVFRLIGFKKSFLYLGPDGAVDAMIF